MASTVRKTPLSRVALFVLALAVGAMALVATAQTARAASVTPTQVSGNPTCKTLLSPGPSYEIKVDPPKSGSYGPLTVTFSPDGKLVDFTSTVKVLGVFVKGGTDGGNFYDYRPLGGTLGDTGLKLPTDQQISHVSFCWDQEPISPEDALDVSKTADATYDRKIEWELSKTVDDNSHSGNAGQTAGTSKWKVEATKKETLSNFKVTGKISITNPNNQSVGFSVTDKLDDGTMADVDCDTTVAGNQATGTVPANDTVYCDYVANPTSKAATSNNVQVSSTTTGVPGDSALAPVNWKENVLGDETVKLADARFPSNTDLNRDINASTTVEQPETFDCPSDPSKYTDGKYSFKETNTANIKGVTTDQSASADVNVDCSLAALTASKTADATYDRTIKWDLAKTVTLQSTFSGKAGDSFNYTWNVGATKSVVENNYKVTGEITINNPAAINQKFSVTDVLDGTTTATVTCPSDTVLAGKSVVCSYTAAIAGAKENNATVTAPGNNEVVATASVGTYTANVIGDEQVTLADPLLSYSQLISGNTAETFPRTFTCPTDPTKYTNYTFTKSIINTATLKGANTNLSKDATVKFTCTYPWRSETATGTGIRYTGTSNWFMYTPYQTTKVDLIAGQHYDAGDIYMTRSGGNT